MSCFGFLRRLSCCRASAASPGPVLAHAGTAAPRLAPLHAGPATPQELVPLTRRTLRTASASCFAASRPVYLQIDHEATRCRCAVLEATERYHHEIAAAQQRFGERVVFQPVNADGRLLGHLVSPLLRTGRLPSRLLLAARRQGDASESVLRTAIPVSVHAPLPGEQRPIQQARLLRRDQLPEPAPEALPDYRIYSRALTPGEAAEFASNAGRDAAHIRPVALFVAVPDARLPLSGLLRALRPEDYAGIAVALA